MEHPVSTRRMAAIIIGVAAILAFWSSRGDSLVVDEVPHIGAGYSYVRMADMRLNPEHPPLVKDLAGLSLLTLNLKETAFDNAPWRTDVNGQWNFGRTLIFGSGNNPDRIKTFARLPVLAVFFIGSSWLLWRWTRERYGDTASILALVLFAFSPTIIAHARLVTTDMAAAAGVLFSTYFFLRFLRAPARGTFVWSALTLGLALLCKFSNVLLGPYFLIIAVLFGLDGRWHDRRHWIGAARLLGLTVLVGAAAFVCVVWPFYLVHTWNYPPQRQLSDTTSILGWQQNGTLKSVVLWAADKPVIRAAGQWGLGLAMVVQRNAGGNTIYWLGRVVKVGGPWYFPIVYFLKEPLAWWVLVSMAVTALAFHRRRHRGEPKAGTWWSRHTEEWVWLLWLVIYWVVSIRSTLNIGIRHLLPVYPFTIMLVTGRLSVLTDWLRAHDRVRLKWFSWGIALLVGWYIFESVHVFPYYLTYFNQIAGGPSGGYRYVVDSNLDWGQDAIRLSRWVTDHGIARISVDYFGWTDVGYYLKSRYVWTTSTQWKSARDFLRNNRSDGWLAVSATFLQNSNGEKTFPDSAVGNYRWLLDYQPETVVGHSIFVWHIVAPQ